MIRFLDIKNLDQEDLIDLLLEYTERCTNSLRGSALNEQEYKDYKEAIDEIAMEIQRRKSGLSNYNERTSC